MAGGTVREAGAGSKACTVARCTRRRSLLGRLALPIGCPARRLACWLLRQQATWFPAVPLCWRLKAGTWRHAHGETVRPPGGEPGAVSPTWQRATERTVRAGRLSICGIERHGAGLANEPVALDIFFPRLSHRTALPRGIRHRPPQFPIIAVQPAAIRRYTEDVAVCGGRFGRAGNYRCTGVARCAPGRASSSGEG